MYLISFVTDCKILIFFCRSLPSPEHITYEIVMLMQTKQNSIITKFIISSEFNYRRQIGIIDVSIWTDNTTENLNLL